LFFMFGVGSGLFGGLITHSEEFYRVCVSDCVWSRNLNTVAVWARVGLLRHRRNKINTCYFRQILTRFQNGQWFTSMSKTMESLCHIQRTTQYTSVTEFVQCLKIPSASFY
jgi:hypothetical protein